MRLLIYTGWPVKAWRIPDEQVARLRGALPDATILHATNADEASRDIVDVDASLSPWLTPAILGAATRLRWVHSSAAAVSDLLPLELGQHGVEGDEIAVDVRDEPDPRHQGPSSRSRLTAALISARCVNACGKFPSSSPVAPICSE